ncbi:MAG: 50S ribosomal protein L29 [Candidatus Pacearchaeota archaeon]|nr:MAG: 50S ribosomal protein L29 [Candidatus Pacearchaeota archaeon]
MAILRNREIQVWNKKELLNKRKELQLELLKLKIQKGQASAGTKKLKEIKKTIARINTKLNQLKE